MKGAQNGESRGRQVATGIDESVYVTGVYFGNGHFGPYAFSGNPQRGSMALIKYDSLGSIQWMLSANWTSPEGVATDLFGNVYVLAQYVDSSVSFGGHTLNKPYKDSGRYFIAKVTSAGNVLWLKELGNSNPASIDDQGNRIKIDYWGNIYVAFDFKGNLTIDGHSFTSSGWADMILAKFDSSGTMKWIKKFGGKVNDLPSELALSPNGNIYVVGLFNSDSLNFGGTVLTDTLSNFRWNCFITKFDASGNVIWANASKNTTDCIAYGVCLDNYENVFVTGGYGVGYYPPAALSFGSLTLDIVPSFSYYGFLTKFDYNGNALWGKTMRGKQILSYGAITDALNNVWILAANFTYTFNTPINDTINGHIISAPAINASPIFISGWTMAGSYISTSMLSSGTNGSVNGIACDRGGNLYITCRTQIDTFIVAGDSLYNTTGPVYKGHPVNMYVAKYNPNLSPPYVRLPSNIPKQASDIKRTASDLYPNPTSGIFNVNTCTAGILCVYSIDGRFISRLAIKEGVTEIRALESLPSGQYLVTIQTDDVESELLPLIKE